MRIGKQNQEKVIVTVKSTKVIESGKRKGKVGYVTFESVDVFEVTPEAVYKVIYAALRDAK